MVDNAPYEMNWRIDSQGNSYSISITEILVVSDIYLNVVLEEIPSTNHRVTVKNGEVILSEAMSRDLITGNKFYVDYNNGIVYFGSDLAGLTLTFSYYGRGYKRISAKRIVEFNIETETLSEVDASQQQQIDALELMVERLQAQIDFLVDELDKLT